MRFDDVLVAGRLKEIYLSYYFEFLVQEEERKIIDLGTYTVGHQ
jgi:hypothetical protein